jgi:hypothetical protein
MNSGFTFQMLTQIDHFNFGEIGIFRSTAVDVVKKYGVDYERFQYCENVFSLTYSKIGLSFLCGNWYYPDAIGFGTFYVFEVTIESPSELATTKKIQPAFSTLFEVVDLYGYPISLSGCFESGRNFHTLVYRGLNFGFISDGRNRPWKIDDNLDQPVDFIRVIGAEDHLDVLYERTKIDRWLKFCSFMENSDWSLLADGSLTYFEWQAYYGYGRYFEQSRIRCPAGEHNLDDLYSHLFNFCIEKSPIDGVEYQSCDGLQFTANQSIGMALEKFFIVEAAELADLKRRIIAKDFDDYIWLT